MISKIYVGNLSYETENSDLENLFANAGTVLTANVIKDRHTGQARGFGFVEMENLDMAEEAISNFHDKDFMGRSLIVNLAKKKSESGNFRR